MIPPGEGWGLDVGGGAGGLGLYVQEKGYNYVNTDLFPEGVLRSVKCDVCNLPFKDETFTLVVSRDAFEHLEGPFQAIGEVRRVLKPGCKFLLWVPFMFPFHGTDYYRYTPLTLRKMMKGFKILRFDSPLWAFSLFGNLMIETSKRIKFGFLEGSIRQICWTLDWFARRPRLNPRSFAGAYFIVAEREPD